MNWVDLLIVGAVGAAIYSGWRRGALMQVFSWGGFVVGLFIGGAIAPTLVGFVNPTTPLARAMVTIGVFLGVAFLVEALLAVAGHRLRKKMTTTRAANIDAVVGCVVAGLLALVASWFLGATLRRGPSQELAAAVRGSAILNAADRVAPTPPHFFAQIGRLLSRSGFPEVFAQLNPSLAPSVEPAPASLKNDPEIFRAARLTFKIESTGCGGKVDGSGFPVGDDLVVTAAHVVAGTKDTVVIRVYDRQTYPARVIYMDTRKDIAILRAPSLRRTWRLEVDPKRAERGTDGAAIGYPGGGNQVIEVARVRAHADAVGRDIYSERLVQREIYVLRARVRQGNSGGPFVDSDGRVRGMIFAAASGDPEESYALTETEINRALDRARDRTAAVSTGRCAL